jgi:hypothetical protein
VHDCCVIGLSIAVPKYLRKQLKEGLILAYAFRGFSSLWKGEYGRAQKLLP